MICRFFIAAFLVLSSLKVFSQKALHPLRLGVEYDYGWILNTENPEYQPGASIAFADRLQENSRWLFGWSVGYRATNPNRCSYRSFRTASIVPTLSYNILERQVCLVAYMGISVNIPLNYECNMYNNTPQLYESHDQFSVLSPVLGLDFQVPVFKRLYLSAGPKALAAGFIDFEYLSVGISGKLLYEFTPE